MARATPPSLVMEWGSVVRTCCCCCCFFCCCSCWALASNEDADGDAFPPDAAGPHRPFVWVRRRPARLRRDDAAAEARPALIVVVQP